MKFADRTTTSALVEMPLLIYGTAWKKEKTAPLVVEAVQHGFWGIDTACQPKHYSEPSVGEALQTLGHQGISRHSLFLQTKFTSIGGQDPDNIPYDPRAPAQEQVRQSLHTSLCNLKTNYLDSFVLHSPLETYEKTLTVWRTMESLFETGTVRQLGISNCYSLPVMTQLYQDAAIKPAVLQNRFYQETDYDIDLRRWCRENNIIYQSFWTLTANPSILRSATINELSKKHQKSEAQTLFRYLTQIGVAPLTGTCSPAHMREDLEIFEYELSPIDIERMDQLILHHTS